MDTTSLIHNFYNALSRDLLVYMLTVIVTAVIAWVVWYSKWMKHRRAWFAAAIVLTIVGGGLAAAAYSYRVGIPAKLEADLVAVQKNFESARQAIVDRYGAERGVPHFRRLAIIWTVVGGVAIATMVSFRQPVVLGVCSAVLFLSLASFVLDLTAFMRDMTYTAQWINLRP